MAKAKQKRKEEIHMLVVELAGIHNGTVMVLLEMGVDPKITDSLHKNFNRKLAELQHLALNEE